MQPGRASAPSIYQIAFPATDSGSATRFYAPHPLTLTPADPGATLAAATGGLRLGWAYDSGAAPASDANTVPAGIGGTLRLPRAGMYWIRCERWGTTGGGTIQLPFRAIPEMEPLPVGFYSTLPLARRVITAAPSVSSTTSTPITLADMLEGVVAITVQNPSGSPGSLQCRFGVNPGATQFELIAVGAEKTWEGARLPLADFRVQLSVLGPTNIRILRYIR
jgi:hypothetical protein